MNYVGDTGGQWALPKIEISVEPDKSRVITTQNTVLLNHGRSR